MKIASADANCFGKDIDLHSTNSLQKEFNVLAADEDVNTMSFTRLLNMQSCNGIGEHLTDLDVLGIDNFCTDMVATDLDEVDDDDFDDEAVREANYNPLNESTWKDLTFGSEAEAYTFYSSYAKSRGFGIRKSNVRRNSKNEKILFPNYLNMMCHKEGFKRVPKMIAVDLSKKKVAVSNYRAATRGITRTGCQAQIKLKFDFVRGVYFIYKWTDLHNHPLIDDDKRHFMRMNRSITEEQKIVIANHLAAGIPARSIFDIMVRGAGGLKKLGFLRKDLKNYLCLLKQNALRPGEATVLQSWFRQQALARPGFYYDIQLDEDEAICSIVWADCIMRADYSLFGDFVSFDTTYRTKKNYRPLGVFVGFNHHKTTCVFGGALLYDESAVTFNWLPQSFLKCMNGKKPDTFMTDQAHAIAVAVRQVFPDVFQALCTWHIKQNAIKKLGSSATATFLDEFKHVVKHVDNEEQFGYSWKLMMDKCFDTRRRTDINWLRFIYNSRKQWSSAWVKDTFTDGKRTTQLSEQFNAFARYY